ncbi:MAG: nucleotide exchange factor GrpE, partial [Dictyoglomus turgidum]
MEEKEVLGKEEKVPEASVEDWEIKYIRLQAEFENFRQRLRREK